MARKSSSGGRLDDMRHVLIVVGLLVGILGTLGLGAALRVEPRMEHASAATPSAAVPLPPRPAPAYEPPAEDTAEEEALGGDPDQPDSFDDLDASGLPAAEPAPASGEVDRAEPEPPSERFTLQFMVACKPEVVARVRAALPDDDALRISAVEVAGQPCQRIAWGRFESAERARDAARDAPAALLALTKEPLVRGLDELEP